MFLRISMDRSQNFLKRHKNFALLANDMGMNSLVSSQAMLDSFKKMTDILDKERSNLIEILTYLVDNNFAKLYPMFTQSVLTYILNKAVSLQFPKDICLDTTIELASKAIPQMAEKSSNAVFESTQISLQTCKKANRPDLSENILARTLPLIMDISENDNNDAAVMLAGIIMEQHDIEWTQIMIKGLSFRCKEFVFSAEGVSKPDGNDNTLKPFEEAAKTYPALVA